jgi:hypothetical protein
VGEAIGIFGELTLPPSPSLLHPGYQSSVEISALVQLENAVKGLWSPQWPADFPKIDHAAAAKGSQIYRANCVSCHALINRTDPNRRVVAVMGDSSTDPQASRNFYGRKGPSGKLNGVHVNFVPGTRKVPPIADADTMLTNVIVGTILGQAKQGLHSEVKQFTFHSKHGGGGAPISGGSAAKYKARPLNGIWATAPYLHNGSVPNLDALLRPAAQRPRSFSTGVRTFDAVRVGYLTDVRGFPRFEVERADGTPIPGNSNAGHEDGANLTDQERSQLIEYLKTL